MQRNLYVSNGCHLIAVIATLSQKKIPYIFCCNSSMDFNNFWQEYFTESRQLKDGIISHLT